MGAGSSPLVPKFPFRSWIKSRSYGMILPCSYLLGGNMNELTPQLASFRKQVKLFQILMAPGIVMLLWIGLIAENPTNTNLLVAYVLLAPGAIGTFYLLIFKKDVAAKNREYSRRLWLEMDPKVRAKKYTRNLYLFPIFGIGFLVYGYVFGPYVLPGYYFVVPVLSFIWFGFGYIAISIANLAVSKGRSWLAFFWLSILLSPLLTWLILASVKSDSSDVKQNETNKLSEELVKLEKLHKSGAIDDEEYKRAKAKIIG